MIIAYADGPDSPRSAPSVVAAAAGCADGEAGVLLGWTLESRRWLHDPALRGATVLAGYALTEAVAAGRIRYLPVRLGTMPSFVHDVARPDVAVVTGVRRGSDLVFGSTVGYGPAAARAATAVVVEVDEEGADFGGPPIPGNIVATIPRPVVLEPLSPPHEPDAIELAIAHNVVALLPDNATLQYGPGGIAEAIIASLERPVRIWSGLATDAVAELDRRGLLVAPAVAAYVWGTQAMADLAACGRLELRPVEDTHDVSRLAAIERFVGCNTALQVGLDGAVNVERVGGRVVAGIGGHADFCAGAARSHGGLAIVALRSQTRSGVSTIVPHVDVVSTPRCDVDVVVTEHGVADLRGIDDAERARRLVRVAAPERRATLEAAIG